MTRRSSWWWTLATTTGNQEGVRKDHELFLCSFLVFLCIVLGASFSFLVLLFRSLVFLFVGFLALLCLFLVFLFVGSWCFFLFVLGVGSWWWFGVCSCLVFSLCLFLVFLCLVLLWKGRVLLMVHLARVFCVRLAHTVLSLMSGKPGEVVRFFYFFFSFHQKLREDEESSLNMLRPETPVGSARAIGFGLVDAHERSATCVSPSPA